MSSVTLPLDRLGIEVGHYTDEVARTGATVFICRRSANIGIHLAGGNSVTFNTPGFEPGHAAQLAHAVVLAGRSTWGLISVFGVMEALADQGVGNRLPDDIIPAVTGAVIYDLGVGNPKARLTAHDGGTATRLASPGPLEVGRVGVGTGATTGKWYRGTLRPGGFGAAGVESAHGILVAGFVVTNALGDVVRDGSRNVPTPSDDLRGLVGSMDLGPLAAQEMAAPTPATTLAVVATNVALDNAELRFVAEHATHGVVRSVHPAGLMSDGDVSFALSSLGGERLVLPDVPRSTVIDAVCRSAEIAVERAALMSVRLNSPAPSSPEAVIG